MKIRRSAIKRTISVLVAVAMILSIAFTPAEVSAAAGGSNVKCKVTFHNANSDTVIKKGTKFKIQYSAVSSNGAKVKIKFKSSKKKVATVSKKGVVKAKKKGTTKITAYAYVKGKKRAKKTITLRVGTPVTGVKIEGDHYIRAGKSVNLKVTVYPDKATEKSVIWTSSNPSVVKVSEEGRITGVGNGTVTITATAADGSGKADTYKVTSHKYTASEIRWIAHRGLHTSAKENTADAFRQAGNNKFWAAECDIWETKHVWDSGTGMETFDIVINHDETFNRVFGVNKNVKSMTVQEIRSNGNLDKVCFLSEYLSICRQYGMVPIIEIKDYNMSDAGIAKTVEMINNAGLLGSVQFISFNADVLVRFQNYVWNNYRFKPYIGYLIGGGNVSSSIDIAYRNGFTGINIAYTLLDNSVNTKCNNYGLKICTWTYNGSTSDETIYKQLISGAFNVYSATTDVKIFY